MIESSIYIGDIHSQKGARKSIRLSVPGERFKTSTAQVIETVECDLIAENVSQGFIVRGTISGSYSAQCSYGLVDIVGSFQTNINELFEEQKHSKHIPENYESNDVAYFYSGDEIDIEDLLADSITIALPLAPVCDHGPENCAICSSEIIPFIEKPIPGVIGGADDALPKKDDRWAALDELNFDE